MRIHSATYIFLFLILSLQAVSIKPVIAAEDVLPKGKEVNMAKVDDFFSVEGKPLAVWLKRQTNGTWTFELEPSLDGAVAKVRMEDGSVVEMFGKSQKGAKSGDITFDFKSEKATFTVRKMPDGRLAPVLRSERLYADRFQFIWEMLADGKSKLYFLEQLKESAK